MQPGKQIPIMTLSVEEFAKKCPKQASKFTINSKSKDKANKEKPEGYDDDSGYTAEEKRRYREEAEREIAAMGGTENPKSPQNAKIAPSTPDPEQEFLNELIRQKEQHERDMEQRQIQASAAMNSIHTEKELRRAQIDAMSTFKKDQEHQALLQEQIRTYALQMKQRKLSGAGMPGYNAQAEIPGSQMPLQTETPKQMVSGQLGSGGQPIPVIGHRAGASSSNSGGNDRPRTLSTIHNAGHNTQPRPASQPVSQSVATANPFLQGSLPSLPTTSTSGVSTSRTPSSGPPPPSSGLSLSPSEEDDPITLEAKRQLQHTLAEAAAQLAQIQALRTQLEAQAKELSDEINKKVNGGCKMEM
jgi:hypothetical protein